MLTIPEPCHEDFSKMTPTARGAFCSKCQTDTFDFRNLSNQEINQILWDQKDDHLCGQFSNRQLVELNQGFLNWKKQRTKTFRSKFMFALLLVFGLSLFSCEEEEEKVILGLQQIELTSLPAQKEYINDVSTIAEVDLLDYVQEPSHDDLYPEEKCVVQKEDLTVTSVIQETYVTAGLPAYDRAYLGGAVATISYTEYLEEVVDTTKETTLPEVAEIDPDFFEAKAYPNPTKGNATLEIDIEQAGQFEIQIFDMSGSVIDDRFSGFLEEGRRQFPLELAHLPSGMYFVRVISESQMETVKIQRVN